MTECEHFYQYQSPAGTRVGIGICVYCHEPSVADLRRFEALEDDWRELRDRLTAASESLLGMRIQPISDDREAHLYSKADGVRLARSYVDEIHRRRLHLPSS